MADDTTPAPRARYWLIWVDDTPVGVDTPRRADQVGDAFLRETNDDPTALVEVKQCTREDLDWAGGIYAGGIGSDELDDEEDDSDG
jgi:hypothetical protein